MRNLSNLLIVAITALALTACDKSEPAAPPADVQTSQQTTPSTTSPEAVAEPQPNAPDDGAEPVELDPETGWPVAIAPPKPASGEAFEDGEKKDRRPRASRKSERPMLDDDDLVVELFDIEDPASVPSPERMAKRLSDRKKRKGGDRKQRLERIREERKKERKIYIENKTVRDEVIGTFMKDGQPTIDTEDIRAQQPRWQDMVREAQRAEAEANAKPGPAPLQNAGKFSTFGVDVDTGSYALSLGRMRRGYPPRPETVRAEEWLNAFYYQHDVPDGETFSLMMEAGPNPLRSDEHILRVNIAGKSVADSERPPAHLTFVVDVSGSMFGPDKLDLIKEALTYLARRLRPDDTIALVTYAKETGVVLWPTPATETDKIVGAIGQLEPGGSTDMEHGLKMGYAVAFRESHYKPGDIHRVVLLGDGRANVGSTDPTTILGPISAAVDKGIMLSTIGFGAEEFNDRLMEQLANQGNGNYTFIDSFKDVRRVFGEQLCGTLYVIGKDAKIQLEFNPKRVKSWELIGYENRKLATRDFRDDDVDAGEIGAGHQVTALYRLRLDEGAKGRIATARFRWQEPEGDDVEEMEAELDAVTEADDLSPDFKFAAAVAGAVAYFVDEEDKPPYSFSDIRRFAEEGVGDNPKEQPARLEFIELVRKLEPLMK